MYHFNKPIIQLLEFSRKVSRRLGFTAPNELSKIPPFENILDGQIAGDAIAEKLEKGKPAMIARFGVGELNATIRYATIKNKQFNWYKYITSNGEPGWWTKEHFEGMPVYNGFFPATEATLNRFGEMMLTDMQALDILACWQPGERVFAKELADAVKINLQDLEPYFHNNPYSRHLEGKNVLVIHPFENSIQQQYGKRRLLFNNPHVLPDFTLKTIKAVQSLAGGNGGFSNWFDALAYMKQRMEATDFDVAIIGCGAYGFPLAAHAKRLGKIGLLMGGATQLLFGIKGARWDNWPAFVNLYNEHWVRPLADERPPNAEKVEGGCYW